VADPVAWEPTMKSPYVGMSVWPVPDNKETISHLLILLLNYFKDFYTYCIEHIYNVGETSSFYINANIYPHV
jgi:hypothetical protein